MLVFSARSNMLARSVIVIRLSVRSSVRLSVTRVLFDETKEDTADILIPHERANCKFFYESKDNRI